MCKVYNDGHVEVDYWKTHVGHENLIKYVRLDQNLIRNIKDQIKAGVDDDFIIKNIREDCYNKKLLRPLRASMITKKDLWNIKRRVLPPNDTFINKNDSRSVADSLHLML
ncbi:uncharacterized protein LOC113380208 [Ctenocephalides felis]|uniref:uncharacterized protein LOC113370611 n=1 Tax=Ctenocephalides felis TaxID=7515 RepID=UPI000E6E4D4A|nr:uncharacterized protein LOC113370611 [Ctenocephalides felis]XP_026475542.1 uncharacterized protein LOC113380208 [Ctenocephalides felis]XP_026475962.1 uncharacterized protein LOC113380208 [Ctenocephalides felis]